MKVETEELPDSQLALWLEVETDRVERALDAAARRLAQRVTIPGFRRGKAPRPLVERVLGKEAVLEEALEQLLPEVYREAVSERQIRALTEPEFDVQSVSPLKAKATVVVPPAVELGDYRAIRHDPPEGSVSETEIDVALEQLREQYAEWVTVDRAAEMGDRLIIDVFSRAPGRPATQKRGLAYLLEPGRTSPVRGFAEALVGMRAGEERTFTLAIPEDPERAAPAEIPIEFRVLAREVQAKERPELDDYFASLAGGADSVNELREKVRKELLAQAQAAAEAEARREVVEAAVRASRVELPQKLVEHETQRAQERLARDLDRYKITPEQYSRLLGKTDTELAESLRSRVESNLRQQFVLQAIAANEGIQISDADIDARIEDTLRVEADERSAGRLAQDPSVRDRVRAGLLEERAAEWLFTHATAGQGALAQNEGSQ